LMWPKAAIVLIRSRAGAGPMASRSAERLLGVLEPLPQGLEDMG